MGWFNRQFVYVLPLAVCVSLGGCASTKIFNQPGANQQARLAKPDKRSAAFRKRRGLAEQGSVQADFQPGVSYSEGKGAPGNPRNAYEGFSNTQHLDIGLGASVGTAWPIAPGYVVTNHHVVGDQDDIRLIDIYGSTADAWVVARDEKNDLAVLAVEDSSWLPLALPMAGQGVEVGDMVFTIGFPRVDLFGQEPKRSQGSVDAMIGLDNNPATYQLSLLIHHGNSGGPLMNAQGEVVGVVASMLGAIDEHGFVHSIPTTSFAVKAKHLREMLAALPVLGSGPGEWPVDKGDIDALTERFESSVLIVVAD